MKKILINKITKVMIMLVLGTLAMLVFGFGFMKLWNWLIPELFHGPVICFWQGIGLLLLSKILIGHHGGGRKYKKCCCKIDGKCNSWKNKWSGAWDGDGQKEIWKQKWKNAAYSKNEIIEKQNDAL